MKCPQCQTEAAQVGNFWICPTHGQLAGSKPSEAEGGASPSSVCIPPSVAPLRIFLSYGHDANEDLVRRIKADLEKRGHDVWFDKSEIKFGDDWRRAITDGILGSNRVLSFLSKHSTRDPGVCRDEIAIAIGAKGGNVQTILVESEAEVQPPVNIGHLQWLDMHEWRERHAAGGPTWEQWYQGKLAEIIRVVESEESRRFAGEIETLSGYLKPIRSDSRIYDLLKKGFFGRTWLFEAVESWRTRKTPLAHSMGEGPGPRASRLFWITGDPGVGKSAFAAQLTHTRSDAVIAAQFVEWDKPDHQDARRVVRSLAFQLATRLPDYRKLLLTLPEIAELDRKDPAELFDYLLANPLRSVIGGGRERYLIVIDALDEAGGASSQGEAWRNPLVEMLARHAPRLPDWLGLVITSRPESAVKTPLQGLNPFVLDTHTAANRADLRDYLRRQLAPQLRDRPDAERLIAQILEKSEGVFLYVERFCDDVQQHHLSLDLPDQFPQGLGGIFCQWFQRQFPDLEKFRKDVRPALRAILAAREPLPVEILQRLFNWQDEELRDFARTLGPLFSVANEANGEVIKPYHKSLADWLGDRVKAGAFFVSLIDGHKMLADMGWIDFDEGRKLSEYFGCHLAAHLILAKRLNEFHQLIQSPDRGGVAVSKPQLAESGGSLVSNAVALLVRSSKRFDRHACHPRTVRPNVFLCYSHYDRAIAHCIQNSLGRDFAVWMDMAEVPGENFESQLFAEIDRVLTTGYVLVLLSPASLRSSLWWTEVEHALNSSSRIARHGVVPVLVSPLDDANWPSGLSDLQWFDLTTGPLRQRIASLIHSLKTHEIE